MASSVVSSDSRIATSALIISPTGDASRAPTFERPVLLPPRLLIMLRASFLLNIFDSSTQTHIVVMHLLVYSLHDYKRNTICHKPGTFCNTFALFI
jgi:hypothetical protein